MSTGKRRCQTISLAPMAFIHPRYKAVYLTTSSNVTDRPTAVSFLYTRMSSYLTMWLKTVLFLNCYYYYFVPVAPGSSICSERFGLLRKCRAEQCVGEWESAGRRLKQALRCLCCFSSFFFSSSISLCLLLLLATVINRTSLVRVLLLFFIVLFFFFCKATQMKPDPCRNMKLENFTLFDSNQEFLQQVDDRMRADQKTPM